MEAEILKSRVEISITEVKNLTSWVKISRPLVKYFVKKTLGKVKKTHDRLLGVKRLVLTTLYFIHRVYLAWASFYVLKINNSSSASPLWTGVTLFFMLGNNVVANFY